MRALALAAAAVAAAGVTGAAPLFYRIYPYPARAWKAVKCKCGYCAVRAWHHSLGVAEKISQLITVDDGFTVIFVDSHSPSGTSNDAFAIVGNVDTAGWTNNDRHYLKKISDRLFFSNVNKYDAAGLSLKGKDEGRRFLTRQDAPYTADCGDGNDGPVTLVKYIVNGIFTKRAIVDCDADKKNLLSALRDDAAVQEFINSVDSSTASGVDSSTASGVDSSTASGVDSSTASGEDVVTDRSTSDGSSARAPAQHDDLHSEKAS